MTRLGWIKVWVALVAVGLAVQLVLVALRVAVLVSQRGAP